MIDSISLSILPILQNSFFQFEIFGNLLFFLILIVTFITVIGLFSRSLALGSMGGFMMFVHIAVESQNTTFVTLLVALLVGVIVVMAFRFWSFGSGEDMGGGDMD